MNASQKEFLSDIVKKNTIEYAVKNGNIQLLKQLIEEGAKIDEYAVSSAAGSGNLEMVKYLIEKGAEIDDYAVKRAAYSSFEIVKYLVEKGAEIGDGAVGSAKENGNLEMVKYLEIVKFLEEEKNLSRSQTMIICNKIKTGELKLPE